MIKRVIPLLTITAYMLLGSTDDKLNQAGAEWILFGAVLGGAMIAMTLIDGVFEEAKK